MIFLDQVLSIILIFCKFKKLSKLKYMNLDKFNEISKKYLIQEPYDLTAKL